MIIAVMGFCFFPILAFASVRCEGCLVQSSCYSFPSYLKTMHYLRCFFLILAFASVRFEGSLVQSSSYSFPSYINIMYYLRLFSRDTIPYNLKRESLW
jgi:hypothetical protein